MIETLKISGYKCIEKSEFQFKNLTLFTGMNSSGKSSAIQAILLLIQHYREENFPLKGSLINVGTLPDVRNHIVGSKDIRIEAEIKDEEGCIKLDMCISDSNDDVGGQLHAIEVTACDTMAKEPFLGKKYIYLSAERVGAKDVYQKSQLQAGELGTQCQYVFDFLNRYAKEPMEEKEFIRDENFGKTLGNQVNYWLEYLVGYNIKTEDFSGTEIVRAMYIRKGSNRELRPVNVGTGISYISALVIAALSCRKGDTLIIENPEIHLHPKAQSLLTEFFAFLCENGLQIILETHSDHIYNGIRKNVKAKRIHKERATVYFFIQDEKGLCQPMEIHIDEYGNVDNYAKGLFDQFDDDLDELLGL